MAPRIFIDGEAGTTGLGIRARLAELPVELLSIDPERRKLPAARAEMMRAADLVVLCLPDAAAVEAAGMIDLLDVSTRPRLLDASSAHRVASDWTYGFPELRNGQAAAIRAAARVSNPGCYATGAIALLAPLVAAGVLPADHRLSINAVSGYSGGGKAMIAAHEDEGGPAFELYALGLDHKHVPEIVRWSGLADRPIFVPSVGHFAQGMVVSIPLHLHGLPGQVRPADLHEILRSHYHDGGHDSGAISVVEARTDHRLVGEALSGRDGLEIRVHGHPGHGHAVLTARLDNLGKGASGAAIQNIRLMLGV